MAVVDHFKMKQEVLSSHLVMTNDLPPVKTITLNKLVQELENVLSKGHYKDAHIFNAVQSLIENYDPSTNDFQKYAIKAKEHKYTRNLIKKSKYFTLMLLCWPPNIASYDIHFIHIFAISS